jgi:hypothetical protein
LCIRVRCSNVFLWYEDLNRNAWFLPTARVISCGFLFNHTTLAKPGCAWTLLSQKTTVFPALQTVCSCSWRVVPFWNLFRSKIELRVPPMIYENHNERSLCSQRILTIQYSFLHIFWRLRCTCYFSTTIVSTICGRWWPQGLWGTGHPAPRRHSNDES